jgi:hypothetical protein
MLSNTQGVVLNPKCPKSKHDSKVGDLGVLVGKKSNSFRPPLLLFLTMYAHRHILLVLINTRYTVLVEKSPTQSALFQRTGYLEPVF